MNKHQGLSVRPVGQRGAGGHRRVDKRAGWLITVLTVGLLAGACRSHRSPAIEPVGAAPLAAVFFPEKLEEMEAAIGTAIEEGRCPGGVVWIEREGAVVARAIGRRAVVPGPEAMTLDTIFDLASLTKVVACAPAVMALVEGGQIDLEAPVARYLPEFAVHGKEAVTVRQLLTHTSGLRPGIGLKPEWSGYEEAIRLACGERLRAQPDERFLYSDTGPIILAEIVRRVSGQPFETFVARRIFGPLSMVDTGFNPPPGRWARVAPTTVENGTPVRGVVHDPLARRMGGVAGHAGLFSTAGDLARFARMLLNEGELDGVRVFAPETIRLMTGVQTPPSIADRRGLGWDIDSGYAGQRGDLFPVGGFGHTGWTGTSIWLDPFSRTFVIFLSNRNHPDEQGNVLALRRRLGTLAAEAVRGFNFAHVPGALPRRPSSGRPAAGRSLESVEVLNGIDVLVRENFAPLAGLRVGLITNHTGHDRHRHPTIDLLNQATNVFLKALFSPEHGIRGTLDERVADGVDARTGLPVYSLYDDTRMPLPAEMAGLDALVFDIQDIGCRFYTYISTMGLAMEAAARADLAFFVLDRVNPITALVPDGPVHTGDPTFTAYHSVPVRHAMTVGELARMFNAERGWNCRLTVIPVENWRRDHWFDQTGLPWTNPSPNMRHLTQALLYPGIGLLETTPLSVGRGTDTPFERIGAPYIDDRILAAELNRADLEGLRFIPVRFTPVASVFQDQVCGGVQIVVTDRDRVDALTAGITIASVLHRLHPKEFQIERFNRLLQHPPTLAAIRDGRSPVEIRAFWREDLTRFNERRQGFLLY